MKVYAVLDMRTRWVLSTHPSWEWAEAQLREYVRGIEQDASSVAPWLPPGTGALGMLPTLAVRRVESSARPRTRYYGKVWVRRATSRTKKKTA